MSSDEVRCGWIFDAFDFLKLSSAKNVESAKSDDSGGDGWPVRRATRSTRCRASRRLWPARGRDAMQGYRRCWRQRLGSMCERAQCHTITGGRRLSTASLLMVSRQLRERTGKLGSKRPCEWILPACSVGALLEWRRGAATSTTQHAVVRFIHHTWPNSPEGVERSE